MTKKVKTKNGYTVGEIVYDTTIYIWRDGMSYPQVTIVSFSDKVHVRNSLGSMKWLKFDEISKHNFRRA